MSKTTAFAGIFDGQNHEIKNIYINANSEQNVGLFANGNKCTIRNLGISGEIKADGATYLGGILGNGGFISGTLIDNCYNKANITSTNEEGQNITTYLSGIGNAYTINYSYNEGNITATSTSSVFVSGCLVSLPLFETIGVSEINGLYIYPV